MCEENQQVEAHKVILASASPFFHRVLSKNPHPHPLIYLRGLKLEDVKAIVDFIYLGQTEVNTEDLGNFLQIAEDLEVRGLQSQLENKEHLDDLKNYVAKETTKEDKYILDDVGSGYRMEESSLLVPTRLLMKETGEQSSGTKYPCADCDYTTDRPIPLARHIMKIHTPIGEKQFPCDSCDYKASRSNNLKRHVTKVHRDV